MKLSFVFAAVAFADEATDDVCYSDGQEVKCTVDTKGVRSGASAVAAGTDDERSERRYNDLKDMAIKHWAKNGLKGKNNGFDERKYWAYGCHCMLLGDRPMSEMGQGKPVDGLDNKCKAYKDCQKCVRNNHGDECIGENRKYTWKWATKIEALSSTNAAGSCEREIFECDAKFIADSFATKDEFSDSYHAFWSSRDGALAFDNRDPANCPSGGSVPVEHTCCGGHNAPWYWIGLNKNQCCAEGQSGRVASSEDSC